MLPDRASTSKKMKESKKKREQKSENEIEMNRVFERFKDTNSKKYTDRKNTNNKLTLLSFQTADIRVLNLKLILGKRLHSR